MPTRKRTSVNPSPSQRVSARAPVAKRKPKPRAKSTPDGHNSRATQRNRAVREPIRRRKAASDGGQTSIGPQGRSAPVAPIIELYRRRVDLHRAEKRLTLQIRAICRRILQGYGMERAAATKESAALYKSAMNGGKHEHAMDVSVHCAPLFEARRPLETNRKQIEKQLAGLAKDFPVWPWIEAVPGVSALSLAAIVGEAGDISGYATVAKLWKRMGLAVIGGCAQGHPGKGASSEDWIEHGYNASRRSVMWNVGACLIKAQKKGDGYYYALYAERKAADAAKNPALTKGHIHARAQRYIEKRFLREFWKAWRAANVQASPNLRVSPAIAPNVDAHP